MVKAVKFFAYFSFFMVILYTMFPKANLFYKAEDVLGTYKINIMNESLHERVFSLNAEHFNVAFEGVQTAYVSQAEFMLLGVYNSINIQDIELSGIVKNFLPQKIASVYISYSILHPFTIRAYTKGDFGEAELSYLLNTKQITIKLHPSQLMLQKYSSSLREFKKLEGGVYYYETSL